MIGGFDSAEAELLNERHAERERCTAVVSWGALGPLPEPRRCVQRAKPGDALCGLHASLQKRKGRVEASDGGVCIWCLKPGRRYRSSRSDGVAIPLCDACARQLAQAIPRGKR